MTNEITLSTSVSKLDNAELRIKIAELIRWAHNRMGSKKDHEFEAMVMFDSNEICRDLQTITEFKNLKLPELSKIFQKGLTNGYGDFFGLNCVTYAKWIRAYLSEQKTSGGMLEHQVVKARLAEAKEPTESERRELSEANLQRVIEKYKRTGIIDDNGNPAYLYLWNTGRIRFDNKEWEALIAKATELETKKLIKLRERAKDEVDKVRVLELDRELNNLNLNIIKTTARNLAVESWVKKEINLFYQKKN
jgi:hypothetical protein